MNSLTTAEQTAGISRRALETIRNNGHKTASEVISGFRCTRVIDSPMRMLDVLEAADGTMWLRDTEYKDSRVSVTHLHLNYHEAYALATVLRDLEPPEEPKNGKASA